MAYPFPNSYGSNTIDEQIAQAKQYQQQLENRKIQQQQQMAQYQQPVMQQPQQFVQQVFQQPQPNVNWITIKKYSDAKDIALGNGVSEAWFRVDDVPVIGMKFIESGFEKTEFYNLTPFDPFNQTQETTETAQIDLTGYVKEETVNSLVIGLNNKIIALEEQVKTLQSAKPVVEKPSTRKEVGSNVK